MASSHNSARAERLLGANNLAWVALRFMNQCQGFSSGLVIVSRCYTSAQRLNAKGNLRSRYKTNQAPRLITLK